MCERNCDTCISGDKRKSVNNVAFYHCRLMGIDINWQDTRDEAASECMLHVLDPKKVVKDHQLAEASA